MGFINNVFTLSEWLAALKTQFDSLTTNFTVVDYNWDTKGSFVVKYNTENLYILFWRTGWTITAGDTRYDGGDTVRAQGAFKIQNNWATAMGIGVDIYTAWNPATHLGSGTLNHFYIQTFHRIDGDIDQTYSDESRAISVQMWIDEYGMVGVTQNPSAINAVSNPCAGTGTFFMLEFVPYTHREVNDGLSDMFFAMIPNYLEAGQGIPSDNDKEYYMYYGRGATLCSQYDYFDQSKVKYAYKSLVNNKVYFEFPYWYNTRDYDAPVYQTKRWFFVNTDEGLAAGDVISWVDTDEAITRQFYIGAVSGITGNTMLFAIPYSNAYQYD